MHPETDPLELFRTWLSAAEASEATDPNAMALATVGPGGLPSVRIVLLKDLDARGFVFYTNLGSRKAHELAASARAALCFHWKTLARQVRVEGRVEPVSAAEADAYFATRPRESQLGAWASRQSEPMSAPDQLEQRLAEARERFGGSPVPRPPWWSGFRVRPERLEFWEQRPFRIHLRVEYLPDPEGGWRTRRIFP
nr:pyridoxamine 5'-phosphate oxidase [uncultured Holophaga sp.]